MDIQKINLVYFSATYTTRKVVRAIATEFGGDAVEYDITQSAPETDIQLGKEELVIFGMPVYAGRIPAGMPEVLLKFKGNCTPVVAICVYGNRDYDDALLELKDIIEANGFKVVSAGAFVAQHSIFPLVGQTRPDEKDMAMIREFGKQTAQLIADAVQIADLGEVTVKGNHPYKIPGKVPLHPSGSRKCNKCGTCVKLCPTQAIPADHPRRTDGKLCISCGRCIMVCPQKARHFGGLLYKIAGRKFIKTYGGVRREPETFIASGTKSF